MVVPFAISVPAAAQSIATCHAGGLVGASAAPASTAGSLPNLRTVWRETPSASATFRIDSPWLKSTLICSCICALFLSLAMAGTTAMAGLKCASRRWPGAELDHLQTGGQLRCKPLVNLPCKRVVNFPGRGWSTSLQTGGQLGVQSSKCSVFVYDSPLRECSGPIEATMSDSSSTAAICALRCVNAAAPLSCHPPGGSGL